MIYIRMDEHFISVSATTKRWTVFVVRLNSATRQLFTTALFYNGPLALSGRRYYCNLSWWRIDRRSPLPLSLSLRHSIRLVLPIFTLTPSLSLPLKPSLFLQGARSLFLSLSYQCAIPVAIFQQRPATTPLFILPLPVAPARAYARSKLFMPFTSDLRLNVSVVRVDGDRRVGVG